MAAPQFLQASSDAQSDLEALLIRMERRQYPETMPVLASYWLKTVYAAGHNRRWWKDLNDLLTVAVREQGLGETALQSLSEIQAWIEQADVISGKAAAVVRRPQIEPYRASVKPERLASYRARLLNRWLSAEIASLLIGEGEAGLDQTGGIPVLAAGKAIERLLVRERLSPGTLEMLLQPDPDSLLTVYPADAEMLQDVVLALLGRTWAPEPPVLPAMLLNVASGSPLPPDYGEAVRHASFVRRQGSDEIHVALPASQAFHLLEGGPVRLASIIVTMDGRWWASENLQSGDVYTVVYRPGGRLRIDYSADHAKLDLPWPDTERQWSGSRLEGPFEIFGREWRASSWEADGEGSVTHAVFSRVLPIAEIPAEPETPSGRSHSAAIDMAWAALENALAAAIQEKSREPVEQLRRSEFIPLGRAIFELSESMKNRRLPGRETLETQLRAIRYLEAEVAVTYGRVPWRILPPLVRGVLLKRHLDGALLELINQAFDGLPETLAPHLSEHSKSPSQAA